MAFDLEDNHERVVGNRLEAETCQKLWRSVLALEALDWRKRIQASARGWTELHLDGKRHPLKSNMEEKRLLRIRASSAEFRELTELAGVSCKPEKFISWATSDTKFSWYGRDWGVT